MALVAKEVTQQLANPEFIIDDEDLCPGKGPCGLGSRVVASG
jgi:hypothetical protein